MAKRTHGVRTVLCATDLSETGDEALRQAFALAQSHGARLAALHVLPDPLRHHPVLLARTPRYARLPEAHTSAADAVRAQLDRAIGRAAADVAVEIEHGAAHAVIIERAEALRALVIVVGASPAHLGHEAERVVRYAHGPVLVARPGAANGIVLAATDLSDAAAPAVAAGVEYARRHGVPLALLNVVDFRPWMAQPDFGASVGVPLTAELRESVMAAARERLSVALRRFRARGELLVKTGDPAGVILEEAARLPVRLLVLGTSGATGLKRMVLGSVAETVMRGASCPTLVVRLHAVSRRPR
jgi:nucleotide-binding universal stress UspA family protein